MTTKCRRDSKIDESARFATLRTRGALESPDPGACNDGSNVKIRSRGKALLTRSQVCRTVLIRSPLESFGPGAFNDESIDEIRSLATNLATNEFAETPMFVIVATSPIQNSKDRLQVVGFRGLSHRWMRQDQRFRAHFDSAPYATPVSVYNNFCENKSKM